MTLQRSKTSILLLLGLILLSKLLVAQEAVPSVEMETVHQKLKECSSYLLKGSRGMDYFSFSDEWIDVFSGPIAKRQDRAEFRLYPEEINTFKILCKLLPIERVLTIYDAKGTNRWENDFLRKYAYLPDPYHGGTREQPLKGMKIAIDPGHVAGNIEEAILESKVVRMRAFPKTGNKAIAFNEAKQTIATAYLVKEQLEAMGATVLMTRKESGVSALGYTYNDWRYNYFESYLNTALKDGELSASRVRYWKNTATEKDIFRRLFTPLDLDARARMINLFHPHLCLIIHYNVDLDNWNRREPEEFFLPGENNYCMAFVGGSFTGSALSNKTQRIEFLRMLLTEDLERSIKLSESFIQASARITGVPVVERNSRLEYLTISSEATPALGVYSRNLLLTRIIKSPLVYGESLCQDYWEEAIRLGNPDIEVKGIKVSSRLKDIAAAYVQAVREYAEFYY